MKKLILAACVAALVGTGCSSTPSATDIAKDQVKAQEIKTDIAQEKAEATLSTVPAWVLTPPKSDEVGVYGVGIGESKKLNLAMKKANLNAQFELAKQFGQELSGNEQSYTQDTNSSTTEQYTQLIDNLVDSVPVQGVEDVKQEAVALDGKFTVYKLVRLTYEQFEKALSEQKGATQQQEIKDAFAELEARLKAKRAENKTPPVATDTSVQVVQPSTNALVTAANVLNAQ